VKPPVAAAPAKASGILPQGTAKEQYDFAFGLLRQANYDNAELALQEFVKRYPKEKLASNARYWLGETYYVRAAYVQAAEVFLEGYQADPKGPKAPDSLLKLGMSLAGLDKKSDACAAFDKVIKDFPEASAGIHKTIAREKQKNSCP
jgi:tol-pal system protein YbgF